MKDLKEMMRWNYAEAWRFFAENAHRRFIPESKEYVMSAAETIIETEDLRGNPNAREKILKSVKWKTLILIDGASLNGKSTFAKRLAKITSSSIVDIDVLCQEWIEEKLSSMLNYEKIDFMKKMDVLTDNYILENLERIVKEKSNQGSVILVGSYLEVIYRLIIARTLGKYFENVVSIFCCARSFQEVKAMKNRRDKEFGFSASTDSEILEQYNYSKRLLEKNAILLGFGFNESFVADNSVSDMFV